LNDTFVESNRRADVEDPAIDVAFPDSVVAMFRGDLGQPPGGWPSALQSKVLKGATPITRRPGALLAHTDLAAERAKLEREVGRTVSENEFCSWLMYPKVFKAFLAAQGTYGPVSKLPTLVYFYGMVPGQEIEVEIETGKSLLLKFVSIGETSDDATVTVFFEVNGQPRQVTVADRSRPATEEVHRKAELGNGLHLAAPIAGLVSTIAVSGGQAVAAGDLILSIEAMKMETSVRAEKDCAIGRNLVAPGRANRSQ
jgi:pyruvate carboxylase